MGRLGDKIVLFIIGAGLLFSYSDQVTAGVIFVCAAVVSVSCLDYYIENKKFHMIMLFLMIGLSFLFIEILFFLPFIQYDLNYDWHDLFLEQKLFLLFLLLPLIYYSGELDDLVLFIYLGLAVISYLLAVKSSQISRQEKEMKRFRDDSMELKLLSEVRQREILEKHESELHIATLQERNRIAREIHDSVGHMVTRALLQLGAILAVFNEEQREKEPFVELKRTLDNVMQSIRESVHDLKADSLDLKNMIDALLNYYPDYTIHFEFDMEHEMQKELKYCFIAVIKEALSNIVKHSNATQINLILREYPAAIQLLIEDNGTSQKMKEDKEGIGLLNMKERVIALNGNMNIMKENGFRIFISIPKKQKDGKDIG